MTSDRDETPVESDRWIGYIDRVTLSTIEGWAFDARNPTTHVMVEAVTSKGKKSVALAHIYRQDVEAAGYGKGETGFWLDLTKLHIKDETVTVRFAESKHPISREPIDFDPENAVLTTDLPTSYADMMTMLAAEVRHAAETFDAASGDPS